MVTRKTVTDLFIYEFPTLYDSVIQPEQTDKYMTYSCKIGIKQAE